MRGFGFLGTPASFSADLNLIVQIAMGLALLAGALLARSKRYSAHGACMTAVLLLNLVMIALVMWPSFHELVLPRIPARLARRYYAAATVSGSHEQKASPFGIHPRWPGRRFRHERGLRHGRQDPYPRKAPVYAQP